MLATGKKIYLARLLYYSGLTALFSRFPRQGKLIVLNYHRLRPDGDSFSTDFDEGVFCHTRSQFDRQMKWLSTHFMMVTEKEMLDCFQSRRVPPQLMVHITFDDGYRDAYTIAYPVLRKYNIPATFFISSGLIEAGTLGWWDVIAFLIKRCRKPEIVFEGNRFVLEKGGIASLQALLTDRMKKEPADMTRDLIENLSRACGVNLPDQALQEAELMTWQQIREVAAGGITIGSHTHTHRILATLDPAAQKQEMVQAKRMLEEKTGREVASIAYPAGEPGKFTRASMDIARAAGYRIGYATGGGPNRWASVNPLCVDRIVYPLRDVEDLSSILVFPELFFHRSFPPCPE